MLRVLKPGGMPVVNDYFGGGGPPSKKALEHVYKRSHFSQLHGHRSRSHIVDAAGDGGSTHGNGNRGGFEMLGYDNLDARLEHFFRSGQGSP
mmetsp:Transcript_12425/g.12519  ORF Transcript_12425/g.12519 Transcript_12425/m.12519 type:complete len:92 (+) Transcript_12425:275-550(+)